MYLYRALHPNQSIIFLAIFAYKLIKMQGKSLFSGFR